MKRSALALNSNNFNPKVKSRRISKQRYWIHRAINTIKKIFLKKLTERHSSITNKNDNDIITGQELMTIHKSSLFTLNLINGDCMGVDCISYIRWIYNIEYPNYPKNIFTNENLSLDDQYRCYNIGRDYLDSNIFYKPYYTKLYKHFKKEKKELKNKLHILYLNIKDREDPYRIVNRLSLIINNNKMILKSLLISIGYSFSIQNIGLYSRFNQNTNLRNNVDISILNNISYLSLQLATNINYCDSIENTIYENENENIIIINEPNLVNELNNTNNVNIGEINANNANNTNTSISI